MVLVLNMHNDLLTKTSRRPVASIELYTDSEEEMRQVLYKVRTIDQVRGISVKGFIKSLEKDHNCLSF